MILGSIVASFFTIKIALENSVQDSNLFLQNYHITDKNINQILGENARFNSLYNVDFAQTTFTEENLNFSIQITSKDGRVVKAELEALVTRPETTEFDKTFTIPKFDFQLRKSGRWNVYLKTSINKTVGYHYFELDTRDKNREFKLIDPFVSHKRFEKMEEVRKRALKSE
jgi:hypothetical protein